MNVNANSLPTAAFEGLLQKLITVLEITQRADGITSPQSKQALLHATNEFKTSLSQARDMAMTLPGGELLIEEQDEVIAMLMDLRERKQKQLLEFAGQVVASAVISPTETKMEIDSMASTPFHEH